MNFNVRNLARTFAIIAFLSMSQSSLDLSNWMIGITDRPKAAPHPQAHPHRLSQQRTQQAPSTSPASLSLIRHLIQNLIWHQTHQPHRSRCNLSSMEVEGDLIWGNDSESEVFAEAHSMDLCLIFRFAVNNTFPRGLPSRIVSFYHDLLINDANETFSDRASMREALYSSIRKVWPQCTLHPFIAAVDVTVEIYEDTEGQDQWCVSHESTYKLYIKSLLPMDCLVAYEEAKPTVYDLVDYSSLVPVRHLGGRGSTTLGRTSPRPNALYIFKGINFGVFLMSPVDFRHWKDDCYHEIQTICSLPRHPNIIPPPSVFVTTRGVEDQRRTFVCGTLYPFMEHGTLDD